MTTEVRHSTKKNGFYVINTTPGEKYKIAFCGYHNDPKYVMATALRRGTAELHAKFISESFNRSGL